jgi:hypothetical protein
MKKLMRSQCTDVDIGGLVSTYIQNPFNRDSVRASYCRLLAIRDQATVFKAVHFDGHTHSNGLPVCLYQPFCYPQPY